MCGIVGYVGRRSAPELILGGLKRLEYRGYDSSGIAVLNGGRLQIQRSAGKLEILEEKLNQNPISGCIGLGHTRWATHGSPTEENAHPHRAGGIVVVHNGIIENYLELREKLILEGHTFLSETDTEVICHLVQRNIGRLMSLEDAVRAALGDLQGSYALGVLWDGDPQHIVAARKESPLVIGLGDEETFLASDIPAILEHTRSVIFLDDNEMAMLDSSGAQVSRLNEGRVEKKVQSIHWSPVMAEKGGYRHFMLKEIFEQPRAVIDSFRGRVTPERGQVHFGPQCLEEAILSEIERVTIVACGTSFHAGLIGKFILENIGRIPVEVDLASEFRYRDPLVDSKTLLLAISQSGETADTLAAVREGSLRGARAMAVCNVVGSSLVRASQGVIYTQAGPEIGVASTKAFTTQLVVIYLLAIHLANTRGTIDRQRAQTLLEDLLRLPGQMEEVLDRDEQIREAARRFMNATDFLYLGRGINYPVALEGALKLKEISYIHAEGYPAGEMKHGPIALIDEYMPVVVLLNRDRTHEKLMGNIEEVRARRGIVIAVVADPPDTLIRKVDEMIVVPTNNDHLTTVTLTLPLQLLAYHVAVLKGTDVDQPRNLAKSVTVE